MLCCFLLEFCRSMFALHHSIVILRLPLGAFRVRGKFLRYGNNFGNRPATASEKWFPLRAEAFAEALRLWKLFSFGQITPKTRNSFLGSAAETPDRDELVRGRACGSTASDNLPIVSNSLRGGLAEASGQRLPCFNFIYVHDAGRGMREKGCSKL